VRLGLRRCKPREKIDERNNFKDVERDR